MKNILLLISFNLLLLSTAFSQATVTTPYNNANDYVQNELLGDCITASNVTSNLIFSSSGATTVGKFSGFGPSTGLDEGIIMACGDVEFADDGNTSNDRGRITGTGSDPDLQLLIPGFSVNDATILEFDFVPTSSPVVFNYVFASEEYPEYVNSSFNDAFAFLLSGPGISGGAGFSNDAVNIAIIPEHHYLLLLTM